MLPTKSTTVKPRPSRKRFSLTTKEPHSTERTIEKSRFDRSTKRPLHSIYKNKTDQNSGVSMITEIVTEKSSSSTVIHKQKYHARFNSGQRNNTAHPKPSKGLYNNRKNLKAKTDFNERNNIKNIRGLDSSQSTQVSKLYKKKRFRTCNYKSHLF